MHKHLVILFTIKLASLFSFSVHSIYEWVIYEWVISISQNRFQVKFSPQVGMTV